jgi:long-chain fatty acid transport protein
MTRNLLLLSAASLALALVAAPAHAGGFQLREQSALGLGRAYAGEAVAAEDASGIFYNPAQAARLEPQVTLTASAVYPESDLRDSGSNLGFSVGPGAPIGGVGSENPIDLTIIPAGAVAWNLSPTLHAGLTVSAPFGLVAEHPRNVFGRYDGIRSELQVVDVAFTMARQFGPHALGISAHVQGIDATLTSAIPDPAGRGAAFDGFSSLTGEDISAGWSIGFHTELDPNFSLGLSYRSEVVHDLSGEQRIAGVAAPFSLANATRPAQAEVILPDSARLGAAWRISPAVQLTGQVEWVGWSDFDALTVRTDVGPATATPFLYRDRYNFALGADFTLSADWTLRGGLAWDPTPTRDVERSTRVPDSDRIWFTAGASRRFSDGSKMDFGAAYIHAEESRVRSTRSFFTGQPFAVTAETLGTLDNRGFIASLGYTRRL